MPGIRETAIIVILIWVAAAIPVLVPSTSTTVAPSQTPELLPWTKHVPHVPTEEEKMFIGERTFLASLNVSSLQVQAATVDEHNKPIVLEGNQLDYIIAADESPTDAHVHDHIKPQDPRLPAERKHLAHIYRVAKEYLPKLVVHDLFHSSDGKPIRVTDEKVDAAIRDYRASRLELEDLDYPDIM
ncbi:MAG: hypothetical protein Q9191_006741 [Dirinaria sp. TL-2023a]